jgi:2-polyprenyl-3-methyl-5-hydroxy-6-metoxy-1,4-benzoquinol methylase
MQMFEQGVVADEASIAEGIERLKPWRYGHANGHSAAIEGNPSIAAIERNFDSRAELAAMFESVLDGRSASELRVLDMGCLEGHYTVAIARMGFKEVVGIDISDEHLSRAEFLLGQYHSLRNYKLVHCAATDIAGIKSLGKFDIILCHGLLYHLKDPLLVFDMFEELADPGKPLIVFLNTQFKGDFFNLVTRSPLAELQVKFSMDASNAVAAKYLYSPKDQSVFERLSLRLNPAALHATLQQYGYQEVASLDTPRGTLFGYSMNLICRKAPSGDAPRALSWLNAKKLRPVSISATVWHGRSVDGFQFDKSLVIRAWLGIDWFFRKAIHVITVRRKIRYRAKIR